MTKEAIIQKTVKTLGKLRAEKTIEVSDFAEYLLKKQEDYDLSKENELNSMSLAYAENSFKGGWNLEDQEENDYWNSFK